MNAVASRLRTSGAAAPSAVVGGHVIRPCDSLARDLPRVRVAPDRAREVAVRETRAGSVRDRRAAEARP